MKTKLYLWSKNENNFYFIKSFLIVSTIISYYKSTFCAPFLCDFYQTFFCQEQLNTIQQTEKSKKCLSLYGMYIMSLILFVIPFLNKSSLLKSFCLLRAGLQRPICDALKYFVVSTCFGALEMTANIKKWFKVLMVLNFWLDYSVYSN